MSTSIYTKLNEVFDIDYIPPNIEDLNIIPDDATFNKGWGGPEHDRIAWNKGTNMSGMKGKKHSEETKQKMREASTGVANTWTLHISEEQKKKISIALTGRKRPDMDKTKIGAKGEDRTPAQIEAAKKHSDKMKGKTPWNKGKHTE